MTATCVSDLIAQRRVALIAPDLPVREAYAMLQKMDAETLLVVSKEGPCGVLRRESLPRGMDTVGTRRVASVMTPAGPAIPWEMDTEQVIRVMRACGRSDLPVMSADGAVVNLISMRDMAVV
ncbi:MAG: CBS domain-containing protein [Aliishimia sp.]